MRWVAAPLSALALTVGAVCAVPSAPPAGDWWSFGRDVGGSRYSPLSDITPANVGRLKQIWSFEMKPADSPNARLLVSSMTPLAVAGTLYLATPYGRLVALDGDSGAVRWTYRLPDDDGIAGRGIEYWPGDARTAPRLLFGTRSGLLMAVDAATGKPSAGFAPVNLRTPEIMNGSGGAGQPANFAYQLNSSPALYRDVIITASRVQESPAQGASGDVRGWDARSGRLLWTFHSVPRPGEPFYETWEGGSWVHRSGVNAWSSLSVDQARGIVYVPFGAPAYDRIGIDRHGSNLFSSALVALDARTGRYLWHFQAVHHDIWDLDMPIQPTLMDIRKDGRVIPAVVAMTKTGYLFILDRVTGKPLFPVTETPVPASSIPGEQAWPTQPIPAAPPPLTRQAMTAADIADVTPELRNFCLARIANDHASFAVPFEPLRADHPVVRFPGSGGGPNWGGGAFDPKHGTYIVNTSELPGIEQMGQDGKGNWYNIAPKPIWFGKGGSRMPCQRPPWGQLSAVDVRRGTILWQVPLGVTDTLPPALQATGRPNVGGPLATAGGLIFIGASDDARFRAFDERNGREVWVEKLGAAAHATPISYRGRSGRQYVAIVSAGGSYLGSPNTASRMVVFAVPRAGEVLMQPSPPPAGAAAVLAPERGGSPTSAASRRATASAEFAPDAGVAMVQKTCTACHVAAQVTNQRHSRGEWATTVEKMIGFGAQVPDAEFDRIVDYLARNYPAGN